MSKRKMWTATPSNTTADEWNVMFTVNDSIGRRVQNQPIIYLPCISYEQAKAVANAYNAE